MMMGSRITYSADLPVSLKKLEKITMLVGAICSYILMLKLFVPSGGRKWTRVLPTQMTFGLCVMVVLRPGYFRRLPPFTSRNGFQISLKILKVILCGDFLGFHIIHHLPERDSRLTGSTCQGE